MTKYKVTVERGIVKIVDIHNNVIYDFSKEELKDTRDENCSDIIIHLLGKMWVTLDLLYELGVLTEKEFPDNKINWYNTFFAVEKKNYLETAGELILPKNNSPVQHLSEVIELGRKESTAEINEEISVIVDRNLKRYNLLK